jgi:hypothetical protein
MRKNLLIPFLFTIITLPGFYACNNDLTNPLFLPGNNEPDDKMKCESILISESSFNSAESDEYEVTDSRITNDSLMIEVQYGGGCGSIDFELITDGLFMESNPVQLNVKLTFDDEDPCEMAIKKNLCFDLSNLATYYNDSYQTTEGKIVLHIVDYDTITYNF